MGRCHCEKRTAMTRSVRYINVAPTPAKDEYIAKPEGFDQLVGLELQCRLGCSQFAHRAAQLIPRRRIVAISGTWNSDETCPSEE